MKSRPVSVNVTANGLAANQAQQTANQAQASAIKYKTAWEEANAENLAALSTAQSEFKSNLAWVKSQIHEGKHQNDSAVASLQSDMESSWDSMSTVEQSLYNSASTATSEVDSHLESLRAQNSQSLADLHNTANSLHAAATSLHADANAMRSSLTAATSELGKDITTTRNSLDGVRNSLRTASSELGDNLAGARNSLAAVDSSLRTATSEVGNNLNSVKNSLAAVDADLRNGIKQANNDLSAAKTSLTATGNSLANRAGSLATATSELQRQTGQLSGSLSTADSMIMFNSNAIAEVKRTAGEISTTVSNIRVGGRNLVRHTGAPDTKYWATVSGGNGIGTIENNDVDAVDSLEFDKMFVIRGNTQGNRDWASTTYYLDVIEGETYTVSAYVKLDSQAFVTDPTIQFRLWGGVTKPSDFGYMLWGAVKTGLGLSKDKWTRVVMTAKAVKGGKGRPAFGISGTGSIDIAYPQVERGTMATAWTPAPEDTDQAISKVSQTADAIRADLANTKGDVASVKATASSLQTQITDNRNNISSVKQTAQGLTTRISNAEGNVSGLQQTAKSLQSSVSDNAKNISSVKQTATALQSDLSNAKGDISTLKQTASGLTSRVGNAEGSISQLQQTANGLTSTVSNMKSGGANMLPAGKLTSFYSSTVTYDAGSDTYTIVNPATANASWGSGVALPDKVIEVPWGQTACISMQVYTPTAGEMAVDINNSGDGVAHGNDNDNRNKSVLHNSNVPANEWTTFWFTYENSSVSGNPKKASLWDAHTGIGLKLNNVTWKIRHPMVQIGTFPSEWSPSPKDTDSAISQIKQTADQIKADVADNKGNISSVTQTANAVKADLANTKGDIATVKATANSLQSQITDNKKNITAVTQTAQGLTTRVSNAEGNVSGLQQTAKQLTSDMADAKGNISRLQQTATGLQSTVQSQSGKISQLQQDADGLSATVGGAAIDIIPNLDKEFIMGCGFANTTWQDNNSYIKLPTTKKNHEVLPQTAGFALNIPWQAGKTYMQSIVFETDATINDSVQSYWTWFTNEHDRRKATLAKLGDNTYRLIGSYTPTQAKANSGNLRVFDIWNFTDFVDVTTGTYLKFRNPRIWCPDDNSLAQLKLTADGLTSKVADAQGNISKLQQTATGLQTQITNNKNDVASVKVTADSVKTDLTNAKGDISSLKSKADSLTSSMANANNQISTLRQRADSITSTLSNGGVNLLNGTSDTEITNTYPTSGFTDKVYYAMSVPANQTDYVLSFDAKSTVAGDKIVCFMYSPNQVTKAVSSQNVTNTNADGNIPFTLTTDWVRYWVHYTITPTDKKPTIIVGRTHANMGSGTISYKCVQLEYGDIATPWQPSNGDISSLQQTASQLTSDMKDAKGNISSLQQTAGGLTSDVRDAKGNISSLQQKATELDGQIKAVDGRATTTKATADGISARVSKIEGNQTVGSLLKLTGTETGLGSYVNGKLIAGINTNTNGNVTIDGKQIHLTHYTQIDDGCINASKITVHNSVGNDNGEAKDQYLAAAWGQLNSTIGKTTDNGKTSLWGSINQTAEKFSSYYTRADVDNKLSQQSSLISQTANNITALVNDAKNFTTFTVSSTNKWDFNNTKSAYGNWFLNGDTSSNYVYNGPSYTWGQKLVPYMYVTSRGPKDGSRFVVTVWKDNDPTQYQRVWNGSWSDWVMLPNSQNLISAINLSPDSVKISGKNIELNGNTKVTGRLDLMQDSARSVSQSTNYHNNWVWNNAHIYFDNYLQLLGENCNVHYTNTNTTLNGGKTFYSITTLTPGYLKFTTYNHKVNDTDENFDGQITRSYLDSGRLETPEVYTDKFVITGHHIRVRDNQFLMLTNKNGTNFDNNGSVGFQVWGGIVLGQNTIGAPSNELYFQRGNIDAILGQSYSDAPKLTLHAQKVVSQEANSVSSRLSVKTSITKVTYDRALMAVQNTDMYDYRYIADNSGQHYVSGIIDDVHDKPEYNMDPMLINQERTARIDANLLGYHHVVLQEILKRLDKLEAK